MQLIAEGSTKLASVPSGGGGGAAAAGGAAAGGGAEAPKEEEKKEEGMHLSFDLRAVSEALTLSREGGVRRGHGLRSLRLSVVLPRNHLTWCGLFRGTWTIYGHDCDVVCMALGSAADLEFSGLRDSAYNGAQLQIDGTIKVQGFSLASSSYPSAFRGDWCTLPYLFFSPPAEMTTSNQDVAFLAAETMST